MGEVVFSTTVQIYSKYFLLGGLVVACNSTPPAILVLSPGQALAFGTVIVGKTASATVTVSNNGQSPATKLAETTSQLGDFAYSGGAYPGTGGTCATTLTVGAACTLSLTFTPATATSQSGVVTLGYFDGAAAQTISEQLSGTGQAPTSVTLSTFDPGVYQPGDAALGQRVEALGIAKTGVNGSSAIFRVTKAAADDAIVIIALSSAAADYLLIDQVINPNGTTISSVSFFDAHGDYTAAEVNRAFPSQGAQAMVIPQSPNFASATGAGEYSFAVTAIDGSGAAVEGVAAEVFVVHQTTLASAQPHVNVNFFFTGSAGFTAAIAQADANALTDNAFKSVLASFVGAWGEQAPCAGTPGPTSLGLCIDRIDYYDMPPGYADISGDFNEDTAGEKDLVEVFEQSAGATSAGVNFFFLNSITLGGVSSNAGSQRLLGVDGNIPSPGAFMGTPRSGAAVVLDTLPATAADQQRVGSTIAHEGGHYLGLYHVQEADCAPDNLADTPCDTSCVSNATDKHRASTTTCGGTTQQTNENMMFWASTPDFAQLNFTSEQTQVVRRHPLVH